MVLLSGKAKINNVKQALPALLLAMQDNPPPARRKPWDEPSELDRLGISKAWPMDRSSVSGRVWLVPEAWGGFAGTEDTAGEWGDRSSLQGGRCTEGTLPITPTSRRDTRSSGPPLEAHGGADAA
jgi:hypothetical protein